MISRSASALFRPLFRGFALTVAGLAPLTAAAADPRLDEQIVKGTHNSFHRKPWIVFHPRHRYEHDPLPVQLSEHGVRALELDLHRGHFGGYQIYHIAFVDGRSHCKAFSACLRQIRDWSDAHPDHEPLFVWIEVKDFAGGARIASLRPVDSLLRDALGERLLTPDDVRGDAESLRHALAGRGWPRVSEARGRVLFLLAGSRPQLHDYTDGFRHLRGRAMFARARPDQIHLPWAAVAKINDPGDPWIATARAARLLVTTTLCVPTLDDAACWRARELALQSGANLLLDDYPRRVAGRAYWLDLTGIAHLDRAARGRPQM